MLTFTKSFIPPHTILSQPAVPQASANCCRSICQGRSNIIASLASSCGVDRQEKRYLDDRISRSKHERSKASQSDAIYQACCCASVHYEATMEALRGRASACVGQRWGIGTSAPLGNSRFGGLILSQCFTLFHDASLFTTWMYFDLVQGHRHRGAAFRSSPWHFIDSLLHGRLL